MGTISGTAGPDTLNGTAGDDTILGQGGNDTLNANGGHDILTGGAGSDTLNGGSDNVIYQDTVANFDGDHITNFKMGDAIQITDLDLAHGTVGLVKGLRHLQLQRRCKQRSHNNRQSGKVLSRSARPPPQWRDRH